MERKTFAKWEPFRIEYAKLWAYPENQDKIFCRYIPFDKKKEFIYYFPKQYDSVLLDFEARRF